MDEMETVPEGRPRGSIDIVESAILDTIIPLAGELNMEEALSGSVEKLDEGSYSPLAAIPQRHALFFVLQTPVFDESTLRSYLGRLAINLEAQVVNAPTEGQEAPTPHEVIFKSSVQDSEEPLIIVQGSDEHDENAADHILVSIGGILCDRKLET
ncbi:hypothetical protein M7I_5547 [Glarea lozoyensis 74030]|uniref:Uncharacterized protein n=1 Tax=Glarea lozoyensis (strain ATCC 74030 / MF5533) TaxID=1104152 RepID=H0ES69_GLAL7|nr:hypothetical protein M7I_5547 [Glarea lozoyensis 74030]